MLSDAFLREVILSDLGGESFLAAITIAACPKPSPDK